MDCDQVFAVLTAGPFPTGAASDDQVEAHLAVCSSCGTFAEALRPAPELFHESLTLSESDKLPVCYAMSLELSPSGTQAQGERVAVTRHRSAGRFPAVRTEPRDRSTTIQVAPYDSRETVAVLTFFSLLSTGLLCLGMWAI